MLIVTACSTNGEASGHPLGASLLAGVPGGFEPVEGPAGPMDADVAATSLGYVSAPKVRSQLKRSGFQEGYARVWQSGEAYVTAIVFDFISARRAKGMVAFAAEELDGLRGSQAFSAEGVPDSKGYILNAAPRTGEGSLFCQLVWFSSGTRAYEVRMCGEEPSSPSEVQDLARKQYRRARS